MPVTLEVQTISTSPGIPVNDQFRGWVNAALAGKTGEFCLTIRIVDESEAGSFNRDYRNKDYATNILSFQAELPNGLPAQLRQSQLGDLLICAPVVMREANEQHKSEIDHWAHLTVHGVLHLLGHDHQDNAEAAEMERIETGILAKLGISDPYQVKA